ncbi:hypothetical protein PRIPAC_91917 [Pristionchus pacificus]|uniref:Uncharacterized protein n=1 Tax=Pristionchus pacificus TaxID=54126 RepID=A0A2A6CHW3_PRIPA|nr:hypothetical protein PRIPAC_91917 [Pristionchus pacificus]|eukprot:PDM77792.1 hypothetical protein PRIPAC_34659 [Pristionchus pacificus]
MAAGDPIDRPFLRDVDQWMEQLYDCKQLSEQQVKMLFEQERQLRSQSTSPRHRSLPLPPPPSVPPLSPLFSPHSL